jgi:type IV secretion system protein VirB10
MGTEKKSPEEILGSPATSSRRGGPLRPRKSPPKLNKNFILISFVAVLSLFLILTQIVLPLISRSRAEKEEARELSRQDFTDYSRLALVPERVSVSAGPPPPASRSDDEIIAGLPPVSYYEEKEAKEPAKSGTGDGSKASRWSDTLTDPLQGKVISGIKGLTPTQAAYQDGEDKKKNKGGDIKDADWERYPGGRYPAGRSDYASEAFSQYGAAIAAGNAASLSAGRTRYEKQNDQEGKKEFFEKGRFDEAGQGSWLPLNSVWMGTIFEALLLGDVNTDLPGETAAVVSKNIYSSQDGKYLLIPQGSRLLGSYNSSVSYAQSRVQVGWHTLIRPDGYEIKLGNMSGTDSKGAAGLKGWVNDHFGRKLLGLVMVSALSIGNTEMKNTLSSLDNEYITQLWNDDRSIIYRYADELINKTMNIQPTIIIKGGTKINIVVNANLSLPPLKDYPVTQSYKR